MNVGWSELKKYTAAAAVFGVVFLGWACGPSQEPPVSDTCDVTNSERRLENLKKRLDKKIKEDEELKNEKISFSVRKIDDGVYLEVIVAGEVVGQDKFQRLAKILRSSMPDSCVQRIIFANELPKEGDGDVEGFMLKTTPCPTGGCGGGDCC